MKDEWNLKEKANKCEGEYYWSENVENYGDNFYLEEDIKTLRKLLISDFRDLLEPIEGFMGVTPKEAIITINERFGIKDD